MKESELKQAFAVLDYKKYYDNPIGMTLYDVCKLISWDYFIGKLKPGDESTADAIQTVREACAAFNKRGWFEFDRE